jgi:hypothetical protein
VHWRCNTASSGRCTLEGLVAWLSASPANEAVVGEGSRAVPVRVVRPAEAPPYLRACSDGVWTDDLLALPRL